MNEREWVTWRDGEWVRAARLNIELLEAAHDLQHEAPRHWQALVDAKTFTGRAALHLLELEQLATSWSAFIAARRVAKRLHNILPYDFAGDDYSQIISLEEALRRGSWACGDTSAAAAAVFAGRQWPLELCTETVDRLPEYAHVRLLVSGRAVESWPEARLPEGRCIRRDAVSALLLARNT